MPPNNWIDEIKHRLEKKRIIQGDHWILSGGGRYGQMMIAGKLYAVHRLSACVYLGLDLSDQTKQVNHKCQFGRCFNPDHLYIGTQKDNVSDYIRSRTHRKCGHPVDNNSYCVVCHTKANRKWYLKRRQRASE